MTSRNLLPSYALLGQEAKGTTAEEVLANAGHVITMLGDFCMRTTKEN